MSDQLLNSNRMYISLALKRSARGVFVFNCPFDDVLGVYFLLFIFI